MTNSAAAAALLRHDTGPTAPTSGQEPARTETDALKAAVVALPGPRRTGLVAALLSRHPTPKARLTAIGNPRAVLRAGIWDMLGAGLTAGLASGNLGLLLSSVTPSASAGFLLAGIPGGALAAGLLAVAVWRVVIAADGRGTLPYAWLALPAALIGGLIVSTPLSLQVATTGGTSLDSVALCVEAGLLLCGGVALAGWIVSAARTVLTPAQPRLAHLRLVILAAAMTGTSLFGLWLLGTVPVRSPLMTTVLVPDRPVPGADIGWYSVLARIVGAVYVPLLAVTENPLFMLGLILLWVVPAGMSGGRYMPAARAMSIGAVVGLGVIVIGALLPVSALVALPAEVRRTPAAPDAGTPPFFGLIEHNAYVAVAVLAVVISAVVTVVVCRTARVPSAVLATALTAVLATLGWYPMVTVTRCLRVAGGQPACRPPSPSIVELAGYLHTILVEGLLLAIPAVLVAGILTRRRGNHAESPVIIHKRTVGALVATGAVLTTAAIVRLPHNIDTWLAKPAAAVDSTYDPCLVGEWTETYHVTYRNITTAGIIAFHTRGIRQSFRGDGTVIIDLSHTTETATIGRHQIEIGATGRITARYATSDGVIRYTETSTTGSQTTRIDGSVTATKALGSDITPDRYICTGNTLHESGDRYDIILTRN